MRCPFRQHARARSAQRRYLPDRAVRWRARSTSSPPDCLAPLCRRLRSRSHLRRLCCLGNRAVRHRLRRDARTDRAPRGLEIPCHCLGPVALLLQGLPQFRHHALRRLLDAARFLAGLAQLRRLRFNFALSRREFAPQRRLACAFLIERLTMLFRVRGQLLSRAGGLLREDGYSLLLLFEPIVRSSRLPLASTAPFRRWPSIAPPASHFPAAQPQVRAQVLRPARAPLRALDDIAPCSRPALFVRRRPPARERLPFRALLRALERSWRLPPA